MESRQLMQGLVDGVWYTWRMGRELQVQCNLLCISLLASFRDRGPKP